MTWTMFWGIVLAASMAVYFVLAVVVTIRGFADVKALCRPPESASSESANPK